MGTPHAQVVGTYGERCISGSNLNTYADWNANKEHFGDHNTAAHDPAFFPADPVSAEEIYRRILEEYDSLGEARLNLARSLTLQDREVTLKSLPIMKVPRIDWSRVIRQRPP